jgi:catechol 2,3-dioxygenase-like lactoylglutathione lyase family enzyme
MEADSPMKLIHLALPVSDEDRSRRFYETYLGFGARPARRYEDGVLIIHDAHGFALALGPHPPPDPIPEFLHFGFHMSDAASVRDLLGRLQADRVPIVELEDTAERVAFKCLDPDGYVVEVAWE